MKSVYNRAYIPGPPRVPRATIRKAVQAVIKARLEKEKGRPVRLSELKRDPRLPEILVRKTVRQLKARIDESSAL